MTDSIQRELVLPHPPEAVWRALTESDALAEWLMPNDFEPRVGHRFTFRTAAPPSADFDGLVHCEVTECAPPTRLAYSWTGGGVDTQVRYRLEPEGRGTRFYFEQSGFGRTGPGARNYWGAKQGWTQMLARLERTLAAMAARR